MIIVFMYCGYLLNCVFVCVSDGLFKFYVVIF